MGKKKSQRRQKPEAKPGLSGGDRPGTVLLLHGEKAFAADLVRLFQGQKLEVKVCSGSRQLLASSRPEGPVCLVAWVTGAVKCGLPAYEQLKKNGVFIPVVFLANTPDFRIAIAAMRAGAEDFIPLPFEDHELLQAVIKALDRSRQFVENREDYVELRRSAATLTFREREVVKLVVAGMLNKEIAAHLELALVTVKVHRGNAMRKLGARTGAELARIARAVGIGDTAESLLRRRMNESNSANADKSPASGSRGR